MSGVGLDCHHAGSNLGYEVQVLGGMTRAMAVTMEPTT
jgi:hypothetical protein